MLPGQLIQHTQGEHREIEFQAGEMVQIVKEHATKPGIPWDPAIERRELSPAKCPLASYLCTVARTQTHTYTINNCKKFF